MCLLISPNHEDHIYIESKLTTWYCCNSLNKKFSFHHIEDNDVSILSIYAINNMAVEFKTIESVP